MPMTNAQMRDIRKWSWDQANRLLPRQVNWDFDETKALADAFANFVWDNGLIIDETAQGTRIWAIQATIDAFNPTESWRPTLAAIIARADQLVLEANQDAT